MTIWIPNAIYRIGRIASIQAVLPVIAGFGLHPAGEDATFGTDPLWTSVNLDRVPHAAHAADRWRVRPLASPAP